MSIRDLVVIGGGVGGLVVTSVAAQLGLKVTLVERHSRLGGDCLHYGCVPSKTLIQSAKVASLMRRGPSFGLPGFAPEVDLGHVTDHVQDVIASIQVHDDPDRFRSYGAEVLFGEARFVGPSEIEVKGERIQGKRFVVSTGSRPAIPPVQGLREAGFVTNEQVFTLKELPRRLAVLGGGPIGIELAQAFHRLGSRVTVLEMAPEILPKDDPELARELRRILEAEGLEIHVATTVERVETEDGVKVLYCKRGGGFEPVAVDEILVAAGRAPVVDELGLEAAGVEFDRRGIKVDARMRTSRKHIFACGDVTGIMPFTHVAEYQAGVIISNAVFRVPKKADYSVIPWVTYCDPELAQVGLTEAQARANGLEPEVLRFDFKDVDRALAEVEAHGRIKLITHKRRILGASILGPHGGELIHEIVLAMQAGVKIGAVSAAVHAYPTLAQIHRRAVNTHYGKQLFSQRTRSLVRWINRLMP